MASNLHLKFSRRNAYKSDAKKAADIRPREQLWNLAGPFPNCFHTQSHVVTRKEN